ncbi:PREDICTED: bifunctional lysine-specific demethylase and histidyl-hydroxylase NO66 [Atta cephalotes]|uniref:Bifunctional lysine-specific demethylase and histidyl-hydroxylase n=1 Tax=Atta cephalotes TaxID=12957 RepID=A0A158NQ70_ATTCE|nr:PREDICTED: bifunctional lysine-specific demethylase and histidyl-hydroxylase NO66 [Atta cephalotes]
MEEPISAFAMYAAKRKKTEQLLSKKKKKQKTFEQKDVKQASIKQEMGCKDVISKLKIMKEENKKAAKKKKVTVQIIHAKSKKKGNHPLYANIEINKHDHRNPVEDCGQLFKWLVYPMTTEQFFTQNWEKNPLYIKRDMCNFYKFLLSMSLFEETLRDNNVLFTKHLDITSYSHGVKETHNPPGRAYASIVWDYFKNNCSVRMLNPQIFIPKIHALNATLQEFFGCFVGANIYLTPANSQGFAPHYDDVEAFILQIEGKKRWKLYKPLKPSEHLPRYPSRNFDESELGEPILDKIISAGDLLYLPRGTIHQAMALDTYSLHITVSVYQRNSWCDFFEKLLPQALKRATKRDIRFREGVPMNYLSYIGCQYDDLRKDSFKTLVMKLFVELLEYIDVDHAADLMAKRHIHDSLPPYIFKPERRCTILEDGENLYNRPKRYGKIKLSTEIRLLRLYCIRLIKEDKVYKIYYSTENSKEYHEYEPQYLEIDKEFVPAIKQIIEAYPDFISVKDLKIEDVDTKIQVVKDLWEKNIIITKVPLNCVHY